MALTMQDKEMLRDEYKKVWHEDSKMVEYCVKSASGYIDIGGLLYVMEKPHIKTSFWFGEHTYDYDEVTEHCHNMSQSEKYFIDENLRWCAAWEMLEALEGRDMRGYEASYKAYIVRGKYWGQDDACRLGYVNVLRLGTDPEEHFRTSKGPQLYRELTKDETERLKEFLRDEVAKFQKRLNTYLKRYGLSKCSYGTYWADR